MLKAILRNFTHFCRRKMSLFNRNNCPFVLSADICVTTETISKFSPRGTCLSDLCELLIGMFWRQQEADVFSCDSDTIMNWLHFQSYLHCKCPRRELGMVIYPKVGKFLSTFFGIIFHIYLYFNFSSARKMSHHKLRFASREWHKSSIKTTPEAAI